MNNQITITVSGRVGSGKSAMCGEIEILCKALGIEVQWQDGKQEKNLTHADWTEALEMYKPQVTIVEQVAPSVADAAGASDVHIATVYEDNDGTKHVQLDVENFDDLPVGMKLYARYENGL